jgi:hypothetical protein
MSRLRPSTFRFELPAGAEATVGELPYAAPITVWVPGSRHRRCYGAAVEAALAETLLDPSGQRSAPRLRELMSQLDADGHNTVALRKELGDLLAWD